MEEIFLSYNREDKAVAQRFGTALAAAGLSVWWDQSLRSGEAYDEVTEAALRNAKAVIVLWSPRSVNSRWVRAEATLADRNKTLLPVMIEPCERPIMFELVQTADLIQWDGADDDPVWQGFLSDVHKFLGKAVAPKASASTTATPQSAYVPTRPSIAVMPFANLGNDPDQAYFVDGLMEEIVAALTRIRTLFVIASGSTLSLKGQNVSAIEAAAKLGVRYVLEGSVRRAGEQVRISVKLVDATTGGQIWHDRFDGRNDDIFELQDSVAAGVAGVIEFSVQTAEAIRAAKRPTSDLQSYDLYQRALGPFRTYSREGMFEALELLDKALERDPDFGLALSLAACTHGNILQYGWGDDPATHAQLAIDLNQRAIRHGADDPQVLGTSALALWNHAEIPAALSLAERAYQLNPGSSFTLMVRALINVAAGNLETAEDSIERSIRLDPLSPNRNLQLDIFAALRLAQGRFAEAAEYAWDAVHIDGSPLAYGLLIAAKARLGDEDAMKRALAHFHALSTMTLNQVAARFYDQPEHRAIFMDGIVATGGDGQNETAQQLAPMEETSRVV